MKSFKDAAFVAKRSRTFVCGFNSCWALACAVGIFLFLCNGARADDEDYLLHPPGLEWGLLGDSDFTIHDLAATPEGAVLVGSVPDLADETWPAIVRIAGDPGAIVDNAFYDSTGPYSFADEVIPALSGAGALEGFVFAGAKNYYSGPWAAPWAWVVKTDLDLDIEWSAHEGAIGETGRAQGIAAYGSGYLLGGWNAYAAGGGRREWLGEFDENGNLLGDYENGLGGPFDINDISPTSDGGFVFATDLGLRRVNSELADVWVTSRPGEAPPLDQYFMAREAPDGHVYAYGKLSRSSGLADNRIVSKYTSGGELVWENVYPLGIDSVEHPRGLAPAGDGGVYIVGTLGEGLHGGSDLWVLKLGADGSREWEMSLGCEGDDSGQFIEAVEGEDSFLIAGYAELESESRPWVIKLPGGLQPANASFTYDPPSPVFHGEMVTFDATGSSAAPGDPIVAYHWDFGDDGDGVGSIDYHTYIRQGFYTVTLTVESSKSVLTRSSQEIEVIPLAMQWERRLGENWQDQGNAIVMARDGGYIIAGARDSSYTVLNHLWIFKIDNRGRLVWEKFYDGEYQGSEYGRGIVRAHDEGYMIAGSMGYHNEWWDTNALLVKIDENGDLLWPMMSIGENSTTEEFRSIARTTDGNYVVTGTAPFLDRPTPWLAKYDEDGSQLWERRYDIGHSGHGFWVAPASDGGFAIAVQALARADSVIRTNSTGESFEEHHLGFYSWQYWIGPETPDPDGFAVVGVDRKDISLSILEASGEPTDSKKWSGRDDVDRGDTGYYAASTPDGGYLIVGDMDLEDIVYWSKDLALIKTDENGNDQWIGTYSSGHHIVERGVAAIALPDDSFIVLGRREGQDDPVWLFKLANNHPPVADIQVSSPIAALNTPLSFDGSGSTDRDGDVVDWEWDFGDGATDTGSEATHGFDTAGAYTIRMTVWDDEGAEGSATVTVFVLGIEIIEDPQFLITESTTTDAPEDEPALYPGVGMPVYLDREKALGFHFAATASSSRTRSFRVTFEQALSDDYTLYQMPDWTPVEFTLIDDHTIEVSVHTPIGDVELAYVLAPMLEERTPFAIRVEDASQVAVSIETLRGVDYQFQYCPDLLPGSWASIPFATDSGGPFDQDLLAGDGGEATLHFETPAALPGFIQAQMVVTGWGMD